MTVTDIPVSPAGSTLAPYTAANGDIIQPGCYGVSHGSGITGELIRHATESWAGHAFVYIGNGQIVEGEPPVAKVSPADSHPDAVWNTHDPLTDPQRDSIVARAHALVGCPYDYAAYVGFALEVLKLANGTELDPVFKQDQWRACSAACSSSRAGSPNASRSVRHCDTGLFCARGRVVLDHGVR